jgi:hypothetical protein
MVFPWLKYRSIILLLSSSLTYFLSGLYLKNIFKLTEYPLTEKAYTSSNFENIENVENTI